MEKIDYRLDTTAAILANIESASKIAPQTMENVNQLTSGLKGSMFEIEEAIKALKVVISNMEAGSHEIPEVTRTTREGIREIRDGVEEVDKVVKSLQKNFLIRGNLPPEPKGENIDADIR